MSAKLFVEPSCEENERGRPLRDKEVKGFPNLYKFNYKSRPILVECCLHINYDQATSERRSVNLGDYFSSQS